MKIKVFILLVATLIFIGCGSSGSKIDPVDQGKEQGKDKDGGGSPNVEDPDKNTTKIMLNARYLLENKGIEGISYSCEDGTTGTTSKDGNFTYAKDVSKICAFAINDVNLTRVDTLNITPGATAIVSPNEDSTRVLKSLDDDANFSNGITILPGVISALDGKLSGVPRDYAGLVKMVGYLNGVAGYAGKAFSDTPVKPMAVTIIGFKPSKEYLYDENISLEANVTNALHSLTYLWKVGTDTYTTNNLLIDNLSVGTHDINLTVKDTENNNTASDGVRITVSDYSVSIKSSKTEYNKDENVTLEANVTGTVAALDYIWTDKHTKWKDDILHSEGSVVASDTLSSFTTKTLTHKFSVGHHAVTVKVSANSSDKRATFDFDVVDFSDFNLSTLTANHDEVIVQKSTNLMWVNEHDKNKKKCHKIHGDDGNKTLFAKEFTAAKTFCQNLEFGGFAKGSWRIPTKIEMKGFIDTTIAANISTAYDAKCARLLATNGGNLDENSSYVTVTTRYIDTDSGVISADGNLTPNIGLRCVRP